MVSSPFSTSSSGAFPADPAEISATAQALLQAHYERLKAPSSSNTGAASKSNTTRLEKLESAIEGIDKVCLQLENLDRAFSLHAQETGGMGSSASKAVDGNASSTKPLVTMMQPAGPLAFWPARVVASDYVFVQQIPTGLGLDDQLELEHASLPMLRAAPSDVSEANSPAKLITASVKLSDPHRTLEIPYRRLPLKEAQVELQSRKAAFQKVARELRAALGPDYDIKAKGQHSSTGSTQSDLEADLNKTLDRMGVPAATGVKQVQAMASNSTNTRAPATAVDVQKALAAKDVHLVNDQNQVLNEEGLPFYEPIEKLPDDEDPNAVKRAYLQPFVRARDKQSEDKSTRKKWLDDVFSQLEQEEEQEESSDSEDEGGSATVVGASKKEAVDDAAPLPAEEETRVVLRVRTPSPPPSPEGDAEVRHRNLPEIVSAARPPPPKSALKQPPADRPPIVQRPSFGSSGIRRGFLNLNPSSPGAIRSSYSLEDLERDMHVPSAKDSSASDERPSRSHTPTPLSRVNSASIGMAPLTSFRSQTPVNSSSPYTSGTSTPTKKSVRIKSPERAHPNAEDHVGLTPLQRALKSSIRVKERDYTPPTPPAPASVSTALSSAPASTSSAASSMSSISTSASRLQPNLDLGSGTAEKRHRDDVGVEQEAERIVNLLGPDIVEGHPGAPPRDVLQKMQQAYEEDKLQSSAAANAERARQQQEQDEKERIRRLNEKPAVGQSVLERKPAAGKSKETQQQIEKAKTSAFKRGFLNQKPLSFVPHRPTRPAKTSEQTTEAAKPASTTAATAPAPVGPRESLGMSALDRSVLRDDELSERRQEMGLPAAVPHARPSKAYAEKMEHRRQGLLDSNRQDDDGEAESRTDVGGSGKVKLARPKSGDDEPRPGRVRFGAPSIGTAATLSSNAQSGVDGEDEEESTDGLQIDPSERLENHNDGQEDDDGRELDEEQEAPKIVGEGADTDEDDEDAYFDSYINGRARQAASIAAARGLGLESDVAQTQDDFDPEDEDADDWDMQSDEDDFDDHDDNDNDDEDDDFDYDPEDLIALAPELDADRDGFGGNEDLMREYAEARARLQSMGLMMPSKGGAQAHQSNTGVLDHGGDDGVDEDDDDFEATVVPLDAAVEDPEYQGNTVSVDSEGGTGKAKTSRFRASLASQRAAASASQAAGLAGAGRGVGSGGAGNPQTQQELARLLSGAQNMGREGKAPASASSSMGYGMDGMGGGFRPASSLVRDGDGVEHDSVEMDGGEEGGAPVMIIPQLAPVRFPKNGELVEAAPRGPVELEGGESDDDDLKAELNMRSRLERRDWVQAHPQQAQKEKETRKIQRQVQLGLAPPSIGSSRSKVADKSNSNSTSTDLATAAATESLSAEPSTSTSGQGIEPTSTTAGTSDAKPKKVSRFKASRMQ
ncbi:hypothetical protein BCV70DRAFT_202324 [Testicularia cyperi]|uniref:DUF3835 domain-containing protein n=1 Tax=Testicularia cyperi TaxID=1882483 RepID=A0A317XIU6_9BASI|nr:hypothetical protein BCV70DRAFT_202324 [Testicularia cyperi]